MIPKVLHSLPPLEPGPDHENHREKGQGLDLAQPRLALLERTVRVGVNERGKEVMVAVTHIVRSNTALCAGNGYGPETTQRWVGHGSN